MLKLYFAQIFEYLRFGFIHTTQFTEKEGKAYDMYKTKQELKRK
jgi:hypothetical protein